MITKRLPTCCRVKVNMLKVQSILEDALHDEDTDDLSLDFERNVP